MAQDEDEEEAVSWPPSFDYRISLGEFVQIVLVLLGMGTSIWFACWRSWKHWKPLWLRGRDAATGRNLRTVQIPQGASQIQLALRTRVPRHSEWYQIELMERDWGSWSLRWLPAQTQAVAYTVRVTPTNGQTYTHLTPAGRHVYVQGPAIFCAAGGLAVLDLAIMATMPWKGGIRVEAGAQGETTRRAAIPLAVF